MAIDGGGGLAWTGIVLLSALVPTLAGCSSLPEGEDLDRWAATQQEPPGHAQPDDAALKAALRSDEGDLDFIRAVSAVESAVARRPLLPGNDVRLLKDGPATHDAQLAAIAKARDHIHLDIYLLTDDELGRRYEAALSERARAGVKVRLIVDGLGGLGAREDFRRNLADAGVELREFNSVSPLKDPRIWRITRRNHRKILVVDGAVAFTGGINITDDYNSGPSGSGGRKRGLSGASSFLSSGSGLGRKDPLPRGWRDTHVRVEGPAVSEFQRLFLQTWDDLGDPAQDSERLYPKQANRGAELVRTITDQGEDLLDRLMFPASAFLRELQGKPKKPQSRIYTSYLAAIHHSRKRVWITQAYFAPNDAFIDVLVAAARRGVDVRLLMPGETDVPMLSWAAHHHYQKLLDAGIKLYEYQDTTLHAKTAVIDGVWTTVGSANLDYRSFIHNDEANAIVVGRQFGSEMEAMYRDDLGQAQAIDPVRWKDRPLMDRAKETFAAAVKFML